MASVVTATVKYPAGKVLDTVNGPKINCVLTLPDGSDYKKWTKPNDDRVKSLKKGDTVKLLKDGDSYKFLDDEPPAAVAAPGASFKSAPGASFGKWDEAHRSQIYSEMQRRAAIVAECHSQICCHFVDGEGNLLVSEALVRHYTSLLYTDLKDLWQ